MEDFEIVLMSVDGNWIDVGCGPMLVYIGDYVSKDVDYHQNEWNIILMRQVGLGLLRRRDITKQEVLKNYEIYP